MSKDEGQAPASLESVFRRLDALKATRRNADKSVAPSSDAARGAIDFASASAVGTVMGYLLDQWLNSSPWGLVGGLILGFVTGVKLMLESEAREARKRAKAEQESTTTNAQE